MGIFDALKNGYDKDDDLKDLEELMYDNESGSKSRRSINDMIKSLELGEKEPHKKKDDGYADIFGNISGKNTEPDGPKGLDEKQEGSRLMCRGKRRSMTIFLTVCRHSRLLRRWIVYQESIHHRTE